LIDDRLLGPECEYFLGAREGEVAPGTKDGRFGLEGEEVGSLLFPNKLILSSKILCNCSNEIALELESWLDDLALEVKLSSSPSFA
jgi:hypothetical protein